MAILVSGASGFLGNRLIEYLIEKKKDVIAIARRPIPEKFAAHPNVRWLIQDIVKDGLDSADFPQIEAVFHLAGATLGAGHDEVKFLRTNEEITVRLLQAVAEKTNRFIFASSQVVYGDAQHLAVTEEFPLRPDASAYSCSKINSENWLRWFQKRYGGHYLALRFCGFINGGGLVDYIIDRALAEETIQLYARGVVIRDYLPVRSAIVMLFAALNYIDKPKFLPVNIGSGQQVSTLELATMICEELGSPSKIELLDLPPPQGDFVFSINRANKLFDFQPGSLKDEVRAYAWHRGMQN